MKKITKITVLAIFIVSSLSVMAQKPEPVYSIVRQIRDFDWYEEQAKAWKNEIDNGATDPMAWVYWHEANRMATDFCDYEKWKSKIGTYFVPTDSILNSAEKAITNSFEYYFLKHYAGRNNAENVEDAYKYILKAHEIRPFDNLILPMLLNYYLIQNDKPNIELTCKKWFESNEMPQDILITLYNMLISLDKNAILLVHGDNDTFPCLVLQYAKNIRPDVLVLNVNFAAVSECRENVFNENGIKQIKYENDSISYVTPQQLFKHLIENVTDRPVYVSAFATQDIYKEYIDKMYYTGLAFKYSPKPFNSLAVLRDNVENKFLLDFLKETFYNSYAQTVVNWMNACYLSAFSQLYNHYKRIGEKGKAQKIKELSIKIAKDAGKTEWLDYFGK
ncbi:MAG: hypothetical protein LBH32_04015 [Dysgonamonadaceae bacterium]|nr:hypothetical protein [Dysgonamonadaceae bacterium]